MGRTDDTAAFLAATPYANWRKQPIAADASGRSYVRLVGPNEQSAILMDAPPDRGEDTGPFLQIGAALRDKGLCAPKTLRQDTAQGFLLLEDLGTDDFATWLNAHPHDASTLYNAACDVLRVLHDTPPPDGLHKMDPATGAEMVAVTPAWYADGVDAMPLVAAVHDHLMRLAPIAETLALRDFHAENLIWRPALSGTDRVGVLDYQDAFIAPAGYDLASLMRDARRDVDEGLVQQLIAAFAKGIGHEPAAFAAQFACLSVQRNLRILGVFARLIRRDGKRKYTTFVPRVWRHIRRDLDHPALADLRDVVHTTLPSPDKSTLADML